MKLFTSLILVVHAFAPIAAADDWPQWMGPQRDANWRETGILRSFPDGGPKEKWRISIGAGYAGPAVAGGRVYLMDRKLAKGVSNPNDPFDTKTAVEGTERVLCLDAKTGKEIWKHEYDCTYKVSYGFGPRCTPTVDGRRVFALGAMGHLYCLDAEKGTILWSKDFQKDLGATVATWGFCSHPLVLGDKLICVVGAKDGIAMAFNKETGKVIWRSLTAKEPGYSPPTLIENKGKKQVVIWHSDSINGVDPDTGKQQWSVAIDPNYAMSIMAPRQSGELLFAGAIYNKSLALKLGGDKVDVAWRGGSEKGIGPVNMTPYIEGDYIFGVDREGELRCVKLATGERLWETFDATTGKGRVNSGTAFLIKNGDRFFIFNEKGELIIAKLSPEKYEEISRAKLLAPLSPAFGRDVVWSHPAFAEKCIFARNDKELGCWSLAAE